MVILNETPNFVPWFSNAPPYKYMIQETKIEMWVARDGDGHTFGFYDRPTFIGSRWWGPENTWWLMHFNPSMLPDLTFENSPQPIEITIKPITLCK